MLCVERRARLIDTQQDPKDQWRTKRVTRRGASFFSFLSESNLLFTSVSWLVSRESWRWLSYLYNQKEIDPRPSFIVAVVHLDQGRVSLNREPPEPTSLIT